MRYRNLSGYLRERYGGRLDKICIDGGFTCPNRDGRVGTGGCIFCGERGAGEHIRACPSVSMQVRAYLDRVSDKVGYIAYFQNFTNTYAPVDVLRERYRAALIDPRIRVLAVGTRPDCITEEIADLLAAFDREVEVWVELGLQSADDRTAVRIHRGYPTAAYARAMEILASRGLRTVTHIILGLPGEGDEEVAETVAYLNRFSHFGLKIHCLYVMDGTRLADLWRAGNYVPQSLDEYARQAAYVLARISPDTVIHRLTGDSPRDLLLAPAWNRDKDGILAAIDAHLASQGLRQGSLRLSAATHL